ncbi:hypothetical protein D3C86_1771870 [compost metagenome]
MFGQQLLGGFVLAQFVQHFNLHHQRRQVVWRKAQGVIQRLLGFLEFGIVQIKAGELIFVLRTLRCIFQHLLPGIDGLLQRSEIQAKIIR